LFISKNAEAKKLIGKEIIVSLRTRIKKPDSSPVTESWERNARNYNTKVQNIIAVR